MAQAAALEPIAAAAAPRGLWRMVALLCATHATATACYLVAVVLVPGVKATLGIDDTAVSLLNGAAYALPHAVAVLVCGPLADRLSRRNMIIVGLTGWSLAVMAGSLSHTFFQLMASRVAIGAFSGVLTPASISMVADEAPTDVRGRAITLMLSGGAIGGTTSLFAGGALLQLFSGWPPMHLPLGVVLAPWQSVLVCTGLPGLLLAPLLFSIREPLRHPTAAGGDFKVLSYLKDNVWAFTPFFLCCGFFLIAGFAQANWGFVVLTRNMHMNPAVAGLALGVTSLTGTILGAPFGGWASDLFVRRDPLVGRLKLLILFLPLAAADVILFMMTDYPALVLSTFVFAAMAGPLTASLAATILPELTPHEGRGRIAAVFGLITVVFGMGSGGTLVALVTDQVLHDETKLPLSVVLVASPAFLVAMVLAILALPRVRSLRAKVAALTGEA